MSWPRVNARAVSHPARVGVAGVAPASGFGGPGPQGPPGEEGPPGPPGPQGVAGRGLEAILGTLGSTDELPAEGEVGDAWIIDGDLWVWKP